MTSCLVTIAGLSRWHESQRSGQAEIIDLGLGEENKEIFNESSKSLLLLMCATKAL